MKKAANIIFIIIFIGVCFAPLLAMPFCGNGESIGNELIARVPSFVDDEGGLNSSFSTEFDDYFSQQNPFRSTLINLENTVKIDLLKSASNGVISGKNGYLFSEETVDDYLGVTASDRTLYRIAKTMQLTQQYVQDNGGNFAFAAVPNKNTVYYEYMPANYLRSDRNNLTVLEPYLKELDVNYVNLRELFLNSDEELYLKEDTHWNGLGALYGFNAVTDCLGRSHRDYTQAPFEIREDFQGDLTKMAFPDSNRVCSQYYFDFDMSDFMFMQPARVQDNQETLSTLMGDEEKIDGLIRTVNESGSGSLYILRDSFGRAILPYLIDTYQSAYITRYQPMNLQQGVYDDVVWEVVERNLCDTVKSAPAIFAKECIAPENAVLLKGDNTAYYEENEGSVSIYGILDEKYFTDKSDIYILLTDGSNEYCFEAFPVCEREKLKSDADSDCGFSVSINKQTLPKGSYGVSLVITGEGENRTTGNILQIN